MQRVWANCGCFSVTLEQSRSREPWLGMGGRGAEPTRRGTGEWGPKSNPALGLERGGDGTLWAQVSLTLSEQQLMAREDRDSDNPPCSRLSPALKTLWQCPMGPLRHMEQPEWKRRNLTGLS